MEHRELQFRWQFCVVLACILVCLFAFQAKLSLYESVHQPLTNISSNKISASFDKRTDLTVQLTFFSVLMLLATSSVFLLAFVGREPEQHGEEIQFEPHLRVSPIRMSGPSVFRRPPPAL